MTTLYTGGNSGITDAGKRLVTERAGTRATLRPATETEKHPGAGFTTWCGLHKCRELAGYVGLIGRDICFYCPEHAEAFAKVNGLPWAVVTEMKGRLLDVKA